MGTYSGNKMKKKLASQIKCNGNEPKEKQKEKRNYQKKKKMNENETPKSQNNLIIEKKNETKF